MTTQESATSMFRRWPARQPSARTSPRFDSRPDGSIRATSTIASSALAGGRWCGRRASGTGGGGRRGTTGGTSMPINRSWLWGRVIGAQRGTSAPLRTRTGPASAHPTANWSGRGVQHHEGNSPGTGVGGGTQTPVCCIPAQGGGSCREASARRWGSVGGASVPATLAGMRAVWRRAGLGAGLVVLGVVGDQ